MARATIVCLLFCLELLPLRVLAQEDDVARARALFEAGDTAAALDLFEHVLSEGGHDPEEMRVIFLHLGLLRAGAEDLRGAQEAFAGLLLLDPDVTIPAASPVAVAAYDRAARARGGAPAIGVEVSAQDPSEMGRPHVAVVRPTGDTTGLARGGRATVVGGPVDGRTVESHGSPPFRLVFPREATAVEGELRYRIELLDAHDSVLFADAEPRGVRVAPREAPSVPVGAPKPEPESGSIFGSAWFWVGAAVVVAGGVGIAFAATAGSGVGHVNAPEVVPR